MHWSCTRLMPTSHSCQCIDGHLSDGVVELTRSLEVEDIEQWKKMMQFATCHAIISMDLLVPILYLNQLRGFGKKTGTDPNNGVIFAVAGLQECLQDTLFVSGVKGCHTKNTCLAAHVVNLMGQLAEMLFDFL